MFNANNLLNTLLSAGQSMAQQGQQIVNDKLPQDQGERSAMLNGMGKGALAAGALSLLLGTKTGRNIGGGALKIGSVAALGGLAYTAYQKWQENNVGHSTQTAAPESLEYQNTGDSSARSLKILQAVIAAAKADGHIDDNERTVINEFVTKIGDSSELTRFIETELNKPLNPTEIAQDTDAPGLAAEVYLMSRMIIDETNFMEKAYLGELANALNLEADLVAQLDAQVKNSA